MKVIRINTVLKLPDDFDGDMNDALQLALDAHRENPENDTNLDETIYEGEAAMVDEALVAFEDGQNQYGYINLIDLGEE